MHVMKEIKRYRKTIFINFCQNFNLPETLAMKLSLTKFHVSTVSKDQIFGSF